MTVLTILEYPHEALKKVSEPVVEMTDEIITFCDDLMETAKKTQRCAGLAAPQVGVNKRIIVVFFQPKKPLLMINPVILDPKEIDGVERHQGNQIVKEGCLSFPGVWREIKRPAISGLQYQDRNMKVYRQHVTGFYSSLVRHEVDHLDGIVFTSYKQEFALRDNNQRG